MRWLRAEHREFAHRGGARWLARLGSHARSCFTLLSVSALAGAAVAVAPSPRFAHAQQPAAPFGARPLAVQRGEVVASEGFRAYLELRAALQVGRAGQVRVVLEGIAPYKCNERYPQRFVAEPREAFRFAQRTLREVQFEQERAVMTLTLTPLRAGRQQVSGLLSFSVCSDSACLIEKRQLSLTVDVKSGS